MGKVIVGMDGSPRAVAALQWAAEVAERRGDDLVAVHAWQLPAMVGVEAVAIDPDAFEEAARLTLDEAVVESGIDPDRVERRVVRGHPGRALLDEASRSDLVVVGSRGHGGFAGLLLGSTSTYVVHHAGCPVAVIPADDHGDS